jgi:hypothetical protein
MSAAERNQSSEREIEVAAKPARRRFSLEYKRRIVREADGCKTPGAVSASPRCKVSRPRRKAMLQTSLTELLRLTSDPAVIVRANQELEKFHRGRAAATPTA